MNIYAVVLRKANPDVAQRLQQEYPDDQHFTISDTTFLVASPTIAEKVATSLGIKGEHRIESASGVVFRLHHAYAGHTKRDLWDWLSQRESHA